MRTRQGKGRFAGRLRGDATLVYAALRLLLGQLRWLNVWLRHSFCAAARLWFGRARTGAGLKITITAREIKRLSQGIAGPRCAPPYSRCSLQRLRRFLVLRASLPDALKVFIVIFIVIGLLPKIANLLRLR